MYLRNNGGSFTIIWKSFSLLTSRSRWWTAHLKLRLRFPLIWNRISCAIIYRRQFLKPCKKKATYDIDEVLKRYSRCFPFLSSFGENITFIFGHFGREFGRFEHFDEIIPRYLPKAFGIVLRTWITIIHGDEFEENNYSPNWIRISTRVGYIFFSFPRLKCEQFLSVSLKNFPRA